MTQSAVEQARRQADEAHTAAAAAQQLARAAQDRADAAGQALQAKRDAARLHWARQVTATYQADEQAAEQAVTAARNQFNRVAADDIAKALQAYRAWQDALARQHALRQRQQSAAGALGRDDRIMGVSSLSPFSEMLDQALARRYNVVIGEAQDAWQAELETALDWGAR